MAIPYMPINPRQFYIDQPSYSEGLGAIGRGIAMRQERQRQEQAQQARQEQMAMKQQEAAEVFRTGDTDAMADFMLRNPDFQKQMQAATQFRNEATRQKRMDSLMRVAMGEPNDVVAAETSEFIRGQGGSTEETDAFGQLPQPEAQRAAMANLAVMMEPQEFKNFSQSLGIVSPEAGQKFDIEREKLDMRKLENEQRNLDRQLARESNELKRQELQGRINERQLKVEEKKRNVSEAISKKESGIKSTQRLIDDMLKHPGLDSAVGLSSIFPTIPGGDSADYEVMLETLKSKQFLNEIQQMRGMGALSNAEGQKISSAAESLSLAQSESEHRKALKRIADGLKSIKPEGTYSSEMQPQTKTVNWNDL